MDTFLKQKSLVLEMARRMLDSGLVSGAAGNVSLRLAPERPDALAITPHAAPYHALEPVDIPIIGLDGGLIGGRLKPSNEYRLHTAIYCARANINAVVHTHSVYACALAVAGRGIPVILEEQTVVIGGEIRLATYGPPGTDALGQNAVAALVGRKAALLANHGVVAAGADLDEAYLVAELVERLAQVYCVANSLGQVNILKEEG